MRIWRILSAWVPVAVAVSVIATESTAKFGAQHTSHAMRPWFEGLFGHVSNGMWWLIHHTFRKSGHFCGYGGVALTFLRAWLMMIGGWGRCFVLGVGCCVVVASLDEWHQTFVPGRTGTGWDVLLDGVGGVVACGLAWVVFGRRRVG